MKLLRFEHGKPSDQTQLKLLRFEVSKTKNKKYDAILSDPKTGKTKRVPFGDKRFQQYKDSTGLGKYTHLNHGDKRRRELYWKRHASDARKPFTAGFYSAHYLWM